MKPQPESLSGTARLPVVVAVAVAAFLAQSLLHYSLPLYFHAKGMAGDAWETWSYYEIVAWLFGPPLAGLLAGRLGERTAWAVGMFGYAAVGGLAVVLPSTGAFAEPALGAAGLFYGLASALIWVGGISLAQNVPPERKGLSNALIMTSLGAGSIAGPLAGRWLVSLSGGGNLPAGAHFHPALFVYAGLSLAGAILMFGLGQYPAADGDRKSKSRGKESSSTWRQALLLLRDPKYLALVVSLSLLGGPVFQATNVYRPYRARDASIGLIVGAQDRGWGALEITNYVMQLVGGLLIGFVAGRKRSIGTAALLLAGFAACAVGIGAAPTALVLFGFSAGFEVMRQFMRWVQTGYLSENVSEEQRSSAIGLSVTLSGLGSWAFNLLTRQLQSPDESHFSSALPFYIAAALGFTGVAILLAASYRLRTRAGEPA